MLSVQIAALATKVDAVSDTLKSALHGSDDGSRPGLVLRLDRLEQGGERSRWLSRSLVGALVGVAVAAAWTLLRS